LNTSYAYEKIKSLKPNGGRNVNFFFVEYVDNKMQDFDGVIVPKVER
jgi:hypothetical protein